MPSSHVENVPTCFSGAYFGVASVGHSLFSMAKEQFEETLNCNVRDEVASKQRKKYCHNAVHHNKKDAFGWGMCADAFCL